MAKVLVTGGAGFIGSHLADRLLKDGHTVTVWDNLSTGFFENVPPQANYGFYKVDVTETHTIAQALSPHIYKYDYVFHLAAQINLRNSIEDPINDASTNIIGTLNVLKSIKRHSPSCKFIFASTGGAIYSPKAKIPWSEDHPAIPESPYGISKLSAEHYLRVLAPQRAILRLSNVYGPSQNAHGEAGVIAIFLEKIINNEHIKIFGDGLQTRDFVYVDDVVEAFVMAMTNDLTGTYNVSTGERTDVNTISEQLIRLTKKDDTVIEYHPEIAGELRHSALSHHKITAQYGWSPKTSLFDGLKKTVDYYL